MLNVGVKCCSKVYTNRYSEPFSGPPWFCLLWFSYTGSEVLKTNSMVFVIDMDMAAGN